MTTTQAIIEASIQYWKEAKAGQLPGRRDPLCEMFQITMGASQCSTCPLVIHYNRKCTEWGSAAAKFRYHLFAKGHPITHCTECAGFIQGVIDELYTVLRLNEKKHSRQLELFR